MKAPALQKCEIRQCDKQEAVQFVRNHHSRLAATQSAPWMLAFGVYHSDTMLAAALWNNPSARTLPSTWIELRRMACGPGLPKNGSTRFLGFMVRWIRTHRPEYDIAISYQDTAVHLGTIYKAANWKPCYISRPRNRNRDTTRPGTNRAYRSDINGREAAASAKVRWQIGLTAAGKRTVEETPAVDPRMAAKLRATK